MALVGVMAIALLGTVVLGEGRDQSDPIETAAVAFDGPVVAVLPIVVLGGEERWERLGRALTEDVIADLAQNAWLFVFADATTRSLPVADVGSARDIGAAYAVTGSLQVDAGVARITFALLETATGRHLWGVALDGTVAGIPALQRTASEAVVGQLAANWSGPIARAERAKAMGRGTEDLAAYELYLRASEAMQSYAPEGLIEAEALLQRAVALEPGFGEAWAKLASLSYSLVTPQMSAAEMEALWQQGHDAGLQAYRVAPDWPNALAQAANAVRWEDPGRAEAMIRRAATLAPNNADILAYLAFRAAHYPALAPEAAEWIERAIRLNPVRPAWYDWNRGAVMMVLGDYAEAAASYERAPDHIEARAGHIAALALAGEVAAARTLMAALLADYPEFSARWFADAAGLDPAVAAVFAEGFALAGVG